MLFFVPWRQHYTMIGTHYVEQSRNLKLFPVTKEDITAMMDEVNTIYPSANLTFKDISFYHAGLLPMRENTTADNPLDIQLAKESSVIQHEKEGGLKNFYSIKGVKYTTAPQVAEAVLQLINPSIKGKTPALKTKTVPPLSSEDSIDNYLFNKYGNRYLLVKKYVNSDQHYLSKDPELLNGELLYFMREEMALHLSDVVFRRSDIGTAECPQPDILHRIAAIMATEYSWSDKQISVEIKTVAQRYIPLESNEK